MTPRSVSSRPAKERQLRFSVREATVKDLAILVDLRREMWRNLGEKKPGQLDEADRAYRQWARTRLRNRTLLGWIAANGGGRVLGCGCIWLRPVQPVPGTSRLGSKRLLQPYLLSMYTEPRARGSGVASAVVRKAVEWSRRNGYPSVALHASKMGRRVYKRMGFKRTWEMRLRFKEKEQAKRRAKPRR